MRSKNLTCTPLAFYTQATVTLLIVSNAIIPGDVTFNTNGLLVSTIMSNWKTASTVNPVEHGDTYQTRVQRLGGCLPTQTNRKRKRTRGLFLVFFDFDQINVWMDCAVFCSGALVVDSLNVVQNGNVLKMLWSSIYRRRYIESEREREKRVTMIEKPGEGRHPRDQNVCAWFRITQLVRAPYQQTRSSNRLSEQRVWRWTGIAFVSHTREIIKPAICLMRISCLLEKLLISM